MGFNTDIELIVEVASLYYEYNMKQSDIAKMTYISRPKVSRLLKRAKEMGIVEIKINSPGQRVSGLEKELKNKYNLDEVIVLKNKTSSYEELLNKLGDIASRYFDDILKDEMVVGVSWGRTIHKIMSNIKPRSSRNVNFVQIFGAGGSADPIIDGPELVRSLANKFSGQFKQLSAPLYVADEYVRKSLMNDPTIKQTLSLGKRSDILLTGIGSLDTTSNVIWNGYINDEQRKELKEKAVGFLCAHFIDREGNVLNDVTNKSIIGLELEDIKKLPKVVAVAGGTKKASAIKGALRGGYINTLITDDTAAVKILGYD